MWQIDGVKDCVLTRGGLRDKFLRYFRSYNPRSDVWLNPEKSADVIVPRWSRIFWEGLNIKEDEEFERFIAYAQKAENFI